LIIQLVGKGLLGRLLVAEAIDWQIRYRPQAQCAAIKPLGEHTSAETKGTKTATEKKKAHV